MKLSYNWLKQYINIDVSPQELSIILTNTGLEVEGLEKFQSVKGGLEGIVIGKVITCEKHPNADKLTLTTVDVGQENLLSIVCGAPNVAPSQTVPVAMVGATLYSGDKSFEIKKSKIRGEDSEGMICAEDELGLGKSHDGIMVLPDQLIAGSPASEFFKIENDYVFEIGLTPNRADAASHIGSARDLVAGLNRVFQNRKYKLTLPDVNAFAVEDHSRDIEVIVEDPDACPRYVGVTLSGIKVAESPDWLKNRLTAIGLRPINNIVDITNFVLHETGQPLHAFDADKIKGGKVIVRKLQQDTPFVTLDEIERKLSQEDIMICDTAEGMCIAGVFGGVHSGVTTETTNIFLESAYFDPAHIRKTSKRHGLQTDASFRFERGADPEMCVYALKRAILLFKELAGGKISSEIKDVYPKPVKRHLVDISYANVDRLIGKAIERKIIKEILTDLQMEVVTESEQGLSLLIPAFKVDVFREADVIEEILRIYGYNNIELAEKIHASVSLRDKPDKEKIRNIISDQLSSNGFVEMMNNSITKSGYYEKNTDFDPKNTVTLINPLSSELGVLRQSLLFGGFEVISYNINRRISDLKLYEFGNVYQIDESLRDNPNPLIKYREEQHLGIFVSGMKTPENWNSAQKSVDFYDLKGVVESILKRLGIDRKKIKLNEQQSANAEYGLEYAIHNKSLARISKASASLLRSFDIKQDVYFALLNWELAVKLIPSKDVSYKAVPKYPSVRRDLALLVDQDVKFGDLKELVLRTERKILNEVGLFDIYEGNKIPEGKKSYALSFTLLDESQTLTDKEIDKTMSRIQMALEKEFGATLR